MARKPANRERKGQALSIRVPDDVKEALLVVAADSDRSVAWIVTRYIERGLEKDGYWKAPKKGRV